MSKGGKKKRVDRVEHGRPSRSKASQLNKVRLQQEDTLSVGIGARMRHYGVSKTRAKRSTTGYLLGRLMDISAGDASAGISQNQHDAAMKYAEIKMEYLKSIESPRHAKAVNLNPMPGIALRLEDEAMHIKRVQRSCAAYMAVTGVIQSADPLGETAITRAIDDQSLNGKQLGALRMVLNALSRYFRGLDKS